MSAKFAFLFPGQGAQYRGIGADLHAAYPVVRDVYAEAGDALGFDIAELSFRDRDDQIDLTRNTQPVLLTHAVACMRVFDQLSDGRIRPCLAAGHSLGEYAALVCAEALDFSAALKLVRMRGELMGEFGAGEMAALPIEHTAAAALAERHCCAVAARNLPDQTVVGGGIEDLDALLRDMATQYPRKRGIRLRTEGAFHTYYMVEAAIRFRSALAAFDFAPPKCAVLSNCTGQAHDADADAIRSRLFLQLFNPVLWHANLLAMREHGVEACIEFGGGLGAGEDAAEKRPNLEGIVKKTFRGDAAAPAYYAVINRPTLDATLSALG